MTDDDKQNSKSLKSLMDVTHLKRRLAAVESRASDLESLNKQLEDDMENLRHSESMRLGYLENSLQELKSQLSDERHSNAELQKQIKHQEETHCSDISSLQEQLLQNEKDLKYYKDHVAILKQKLDDTEAENTLSREALEVQTKEIKSLRQRNNILVDRTLEMNLNSTKQTRPSESATTGSKGNETQERNLNNLDDTITESKTLIIKIDSLMKENTELKRDLDVQLGLNEDYSKKLYRMTKTINDLESKVKADSQHLRNSVPASVLNDALERYEEVSRENSSLKHQLNEALQSKKELEEQIVLLENEKSTVNEELKYLKTRFESTGMFIANLVDECKKESQVFHDNVNAEYVLNNLMDRVSLVPGIAKPIMSPARTPKKISKSSLLS
ncbi:hypothetical protein P9112_014316 [Eukaryota sp. TZLM1-RC]